MSEGRLTKLPSPLDGRRSGLLLRLVINGALQACTMVAGALLIKLTFDRFIGALATTPDRMLLWVSLGLLGIAFATAGLRMVERIDAERLGQSYVHQLRLMLFNHLSEVPTRSMQQRSRGSVMLRFIGDLTALRLWISLGLARLTVAAVAILGTLMALAVVSWSLALIVGLVLFSGAALSLVLGKPLHRAVKQARRRRSSLAGNLNEKVASMAVVQASGQTRREYKRLSRQSRRLQRAMIMRARMIGGLRAVTEGTAALATFAALILGTVLVAREQATPGTVVAAMSIVGFLLPPIRDLGRVYEYWQGAQVSREKLLEFLNNPSRAMRSGPLTSLKKRSGRLAFSGVSVAGSLKNFTASVRPGRKIAVVGPNGSGKSTLLSLVARLVEPDEGRVLLDKQDLANVSQDSLRRVVGIVSPDLPLLRGTIDKNLRYRWRTAPAQLLSRTRRLCGVEEILDELPDGGRTRVTEGGVNLSLGQRQRIALARAVLGNPKILLLDEIDANLDPKASVALNKVLGRYKGTILLVTHRRDRAASADLIWYLEGGELLETGAPGELLEGDGLVARFFRHRQKPALAS